MPVVIPSSGPAQNGAPNATFLDKVRRVLRDQGVWVPDKFPTDGIVGALTAGGKPFKLTRPPVMIGTAILTAPGGPYVVEYDDVGDIPPAGRVNIISDTGEVVFNTPPAGGTLAVTYKSSRFADQQVLDALYEGMNLLWPEIWNPQTNTTQIGISPTQFEYPLQALFGNQRAMVLDVEYSPPGGIVRYYRTSLWRQLEDIANPTLIFSQLPPIASIVRITYTQPFQSLAEIPNECFHLPIYFAVAKLLMDQEVMRTRADDIQQLSPGENSSQPGASLSTASYWMDRFSQDLKKLALDLPARRSIEGRTVEALGLSEFWTRSA